MALITIVEEKSSPYQEGASFMDHNVIRAISFINSAFYLHTSERPIKLAATFKNHILSDLKKAGLKLVSIGPIERYAGLVYLNPDYVIYTEAMPHGITLIGTQKIAFTSEGPTNTVRTLVPHRQIARVFTEAHFIPIKGIAYAGYVPTDFPKILVNAASQHREIITIPTARTQQNGFFKKATGLRLCPPDQGVILVCPYTPQELAGILEGASPLATLPTSVPPEPQ